MDPVTGIGLVASVVQLVTFSIGTVSTIREVYQRGSVSSYDDVDYTTGHLSKLTGSLQQSLQSSHTRVSALTKDERDLIDLGRKCEECAHKLQHELHKLSSQPRSSLLAATRITARAIWKRSKIEEISKQLATYKSTLETSLLHRLTQQFDAHSLRNDKCFASLDNSLQQLVTCLADSQTSLAALTAQESEHTRSQITTRIHQSEQRRLDDRLYDEVIRSLFYPDIFSRREQVEHVFDGIEDSYEWIFYEPRKREMGEYHRNADAETRPLWDDFSVWLKSGQGLYWINGKAGSGKSTLMNYICEDDRRLKYLKEWSPDRQLLTPSYFFWAAGSRQQKSVDGLLRSLIYQMLTKCPELVGCIKIEPLHAWNESRLLAALLRMLEQPQIPVAVCMILDGLDEIDGRYDTVVGMIKNLADHTNVKICLSSRPLPIFEKAFSEAFSLRLQDLTSQTIRDYADLQLSDLIQARVLNNEHHGRQVKDILDTIVDRADGVFLWAVIAVRDVRDGLQGIVDLDELEKIVDSLPPELESLFVLMLNRIKPVYQRDAARFLQIALHTQDRGTDWDRFPTPSLTLCNLHLIRSQRNSEDAPFTYEKATISEIVQICETLRTQLLSHTAGLLELTQGGDNSMWDLRPKDQPLLNMDLNFLHRTVRDFLVYNDEARSFLARKGYTKAQVHLTIARGRLAQFAQFSDENNVYGFVPAYHVFRRALQHISFVERIVGAAQSNTMQSLTHESYFEGFHKPRVIVREYQQGLMHDFMGISTIDDVRSSIDVVGMAAGVGMTLYVCERLGISNMPQGYAPAFPSLNEYRTNINTKAVLRWTQTGQSEESDESVEHNLRSSSYRQNLSRCLRLDSNTPMDSGPETASGLESNSRTRSRWAKTAFVETYLLSCCAPSCFDLIRLLLHAGANPMAMVAPVRSHIMLSERQCFWERWLDFLHVHSVYGVRRSGRIFLDDEYLNLNVTPKAFLEITKALLTRGADVNFPLDGYNDVQGNYIFHPRDLDDCSLSLRYDATAMFVLETYLNQEPEFRNFAIAIETLIERPTRRLVQIKGFRNDGRDPYEDSADLTPGECELLYPLIEKAEETGHYNDIEALESAAVGIWKAHRPTGPKHKLMNYESDEDRDKDAEEEWEDFSEEESEEGSEKNAEEDVEEDAVSENDEEDNAASALAMISGTTKSSSKSIA